MCYMTDGFLGMKPCKKHTRPFKSFFTYLPSSTRTPSRAPRIHMRALGARLHDIGSGLSISALTLLVHRPPPSAMHYLPSAPCDTAGKALSSSPSSSSPSSIPTSSSSSNDPDQSPKLPTLFYLPWPYHFAGNHFTSREGEEEVALTPSDMEVYLKVYEIVAEGACLASKEMREFCLDRLRDALRVMASDERGRGYA